jgi:hypothetical protein
VEEKIIFTEIAMDKTTVVIEAINKRDRLEVEVTPTLGRMSCEVDFLQLWRGNGGGSGRGFCGISWEGWLCCGKRGVVVNQRHHLSL